MRIKTRAVYIWLLSNALAIFASLNTLQYVDSAWKFDNAVGASALILSTSLKVLSLVDRGITRKSNRIPSIFMIISLFMATAIFVLDETVFRLFLIAISSAFLSLSAIFYLIHNKTWIGLAPLKYGVTAL
jgi:hypothetical protein